MPGVTFRILNLSAVRKDDEFIMKNREKSTKKRLLPQRRFSPQNVVVLLREAVGFVADVLQQPQSERVFAQPPRFRFTGDEHFFFALCQ